MLLECSRPPSVLEHGFDPVARGRLNLRVGAVARAPAKLRVLGGFVQWHFVAPTLLLCCTLPLCCLEWSNELSLVCTY